MSAKKIVPLKPIEIQHSVSNSLFIASSSPATTIEEAKTFIDTIRNKYNDATHHVPIYIIGHPPTVTEHSSDDGEPSGTAGRPALAVLRGSELGDIVVVITRYFGGTKLGTGGLVRAYSDSVRLVIEKIPLAQKVPTITTEISLPYSLFDQVSRIIKHHKGRVINQEFGADVLLQIQFLEGEFESFQNALTDFSNGKIVAKIHSRNPNSLIKYSPNQ